MTTGRLTIASRSRIATCGRLMIGVAAIAPSAPGFVIVNVPPSVSPGCSCPARARSATSRIASREALVVEQMRVADHRHDEAALAEVDGDAEVDRRVLREAAVLEPRVERRVHAQRLDRAARDDRQVRRADLAPAALDRAHVGLEDRRAVRGGVERAAHVLADQAAHARQRLALLIRGRRRRLWRHRFAGRRRRGRAGVLGATPRAPPRRTPCPLWPPWPLWATGSSR